MSISRNRFAQVMDERAHKSNRVKVFTALFIKIAGCRGQLREVDHIQFNRGNNAAGTRLRGTMQKLKSVAQEVRIAVTETKNKK